MYDLTIEGTKKRLLVQAQGSGCADSFWTQPLISTRTHALELAAHAAGVEEERERTRERHKHLDAALDLLENIDCVDGSCLFAKDKTGMRTNGGCRCIENMSRSTARLVFNSLARALKERRKSHAFTPPTQEGKP